MHLLPQGRFGPLVGTRCSEWPAGSLSGLRWPVKIRYAQDRVNGVAEKDRQSRWTSPLVWVQLGPVLYQDTSRQDWEPLSLQSAWCGKDERTAGQKD